MRLSELRLTNFRNHVSTVLDLSKKINVFVGPNAAGKTSIRDALSYLLTGKNSRTKKSGEGAVEMITFGESRALISADVEKIGKITRTIPHTLQIGDWEGKLREQQNKLYDTLGVSEEAILCCLNGDEFLDMDVDSQKNFIFGLMGMNLDADKIKMEFLRWAKENNIEDPVNILGLLPKDIVFDGSHEKLDDVYKHFFTSRKLLKREIKELEVKTKEVKSQLPDNITIDHKDAILQKMKDLKDERDKLMLSLGKIQNMVKRRLELDKYIVNVKVPVISESMEDLKKDRELKVKDFNELNQGIAEKQANLKVMSNLVSKLENFNGKCPLLPDFDCAAGEELIKVKETTQESIKEKKVVLDDDLTKVKKIDREITLIDKSIETKSVEIEHTKSVSAASKELKSITNLGNPKKIQDDINVISQRLTKGQVFLTAIDAEVLNTVQRKKAGVELDKKKSELKKIEILVEAFGSKGIKTILLNRVLVPLQKKVSEKMQFLTGGKYTVDFRVKENKFDIYITSDGIERRIVHLSTSERLRVGIIMQDAINSLVGFKLMIIDQVDMLDTDNRALLWGLIEKIKVNYDTILLLSTGMSIKKPSTESTNMFMVGGKKTVEI